VCGEKEERNDEDRTKRKRGKKSCPYLFEVDLELITIGVELESMNFSGSLGSLA
jgi:hypothetical protein